MTAMPRQSTASRPAAAYWSTAGTGMTRTRAASIATMKRLSSTRSTTSVASVVQKPWPRPAVPAASAPQRRATT